MDLSEYIQILLQALSEDFGVRIQSPDILRLKARLYAAIQTDKDTFGCLSIRTSQTDPQGEIWVVKVKEPTGPKISSLEFEP
jgi:hypothetical protein